MPLEVGSGACPQRRAIALSNRARRQDRPPGGAVRLTWAEAGVRGLRGSRRRSGRGWWASWTAGARRPDAVNGRGCVQAQPAATLSVKPSGR